ncbi:MAG: class I SAM-dependent methyltransferase [Pseudomonadota bacterium]
MKESYEEYRERMDYDPDRSASYAQRKLEPKHQLEVNLVEKALAHVPKGLSIMDVPCGGGRFTLYLAQNGYKAQGGDRSETMVEITRDTLSAEGFDGGAQVIDIEAIDMETDALDAIFCFRLFHHLPEKGLRARVVGEICRVAKDYVVISYFNSRCVNMVRRRVRDRLKGELYKKYGTPLSEVVGYFEQHGYALVTDIPERRWFRPLHIAIFKKG